MVNFSPGLKICCDYMTKFGSPPICFIYNTITAHAQAHFSARLRFYCNYTRFFSTSRKICLLSQAEISARVNWAEIPHVISPLAS